MWSPCSRLGAVKPARLYRGLNGRLGSSVALGNGRCGLEKKLAELCFSSLKVWAKGRKYGGMIMRWWSESGPSSLQIARILSFYTGDESLA